MGFLSFLGTSVSPRATLPLIVQAKSKCEDQDLAQNNVLKYLSLYIYIYIYIYIYTYNIVYVYSCIYIYIYIYIYIHCTQILRHFEEWKLEMFSWHGRCRRSLSLFRPFQTANNTSCLDTIHIYISTYLSRRYLTAFLNNHPSFDQSRHRHWAGLKDVPKNGPARGAENKKLAAPETKGLSPPLWYPSWVRLW